MTDEERRKKKREEFFKNTRNFEAERKRALGKTEYYRVQRILKHDTEEMLEENAKRLDIFREKFDPITGEGAPLERFLFSIKELEWWLPMAMHDIPLVKELMESGSVEGFLKARKIKGDKKELTQRVLR
jgi:hypothetical protein